jgi:hypothetical protein
MRYGRTHGVRFGVAIVVLGLLSLTSAAPVHATQKAEQFPGAASDPAVVAQTSSRSDLFVVGKDAAVWHTWYDGSYQSWESLGGQWQSSPAAVSLGPGHVEVFIRGQDNAIWHRFYSNGWHPWWSLGGSTTSSPAAVASGGKRIDLFVRGDDNAIWHKRWSPETDWPAGWESLGGHWQGGPAAESLNVNHVEVLVRGGPDDNGPAIWHRFYSNGWHPWWSLSGLNTSDPGAVATGGNRIDMFARGRDQAIWHRQWRPATDWGDWDSLGGCANGRPYAAADGYVYVTGCDNHIYWQNYVTPGGWKGWPGT